MMYNFFTPMDGSGLYRVRNAAYSIAINIARLTVVGLVALFCLAEIPGNSRYWWAYSSIPAQNSDMSHTAFSYYSGLDSSASPSTYMYSPTWFFFKSSYATLVAAVGVAIYTSGHRSILAWFACLFFLTVAFLYKAMAMMFCYTIGYFSCPSYWFCYYGGDYSITPPVPSNLFKYVIYMEIASMGAILVSGLVVSLLRHVINEAKQEEDMLMKMVTDYSVNAGIPMSTVQDLYQIGNASAYRSRTMPGRPMRQESSPIVYNFKKKKNNENRLTPWYTAF